ncbi:MAG TPA: hypothetical protein VFK13_07515 [Gemmatimonadaceae bacterium]|nr:hypothetical protein [Gemmatimonadaceae bacterium]
MKRRVIVGSAMVVLGAAVAACNDGPTAPRVAATVDVLSARQITDTIGVSLVDPMMVRVADAAGHVIAGAKIEFSAAIRGDTGSASFAAVSFKATADGVATNTFAVSSDSAGVASAFLRLGLGAGDFIVRAHAVGTAASDSIALTIRPGGTASLSVLPRDTLVTVGEAFPLLVRALDRGGTLIPLPDTLRLETRDVDVVSLDTGTVIHIAGVGHTFVVASAGVVRDSVAIDALPHGPILAYNFRTFAPLAAFFLFDLDGSGYHAIDESKIGFNDRGQYFLPDGNRVVFHESADDEGHLALLTMSLDGTTSPLLEPGGDILSASRPQPSRDGAWVYFTATVASGTAEIWRVSIDGATRERIGPIASPSEIYLAPSPSPDGTRLAVTVDRTGLQDQIYLGVMSVATGDVQLIRLSSGGSPRWSPVADEIAYFGQAKLWVVAPDGEVLLGPITAPHSWDVDHGQIDWSPDGRWLIACMQGTFSGDRSLVIVSRETGEVTPLPFTVRDNLCGAAWRP